MIKLFLDCDGVLADFDTHALEYFGKNPREVEAEQGSDFFWKQLEGRGDFFTSMPLMSDANELVASVLHMKPTILTGCPRGDWAEAQKITWAQTHFPYLDIITCKSRDKRKHMVDGHINVIIDDWPQHRARWEEHGGIWIHHENARSSLEKLQELLLTLS